MNQHSYGYIYDPHTPWTPLSNWTGDPYRGEVAKVDYLLGRFFQNHRGQGQRKYTDHFDIGSW